MSNTHIVAILDRSGSMGSCWEVMTCGSICYRNANSEQLKSINTSESSLVSDEDREELVK